MRRTAPCRNVPVTFTLDRMSDIRERMDAELKTSVVPLLRSIGFKGSYPHFRRASERGLDLLTFQFDRNGGGFVVELARAPVNGVTTHWGKVIAPSKVTAWDLHPDKRHRLGAVPGQDFWFRFDGGNAKVCASELIALLPSAEKWWSQHEAA
jgi:hypothetical protein